MSRISHSLAVAAILVSSAFPAWSVERQQLMRKGAWALDMKTDNIGVKSCEARTGIKSGETLTISSDGSGVTTISLYNAGWEFGSEMRDEIFSMKAGNHPAKIFTALKSGSRIWTTLDERRSEIKYLNQLYTSSALRVISRNGIEIARFSLNGSSGILSAMEDCKKAVRN